MIITAGGDHRSEGRGGSGWARRSLMGVSDSAVAEVSPMADPPVSSAYRTLPALPVLVAVLLAGASGALLALAFPSVGWWPLAPLSVAGLALATRSACARTAAVAGWAFGIAFFVPHLHWSGIYVGVLPWFALAGVQSVYLAVMAAGFPRIWRLHEQLSQRLGASIGSAVAALAFAGLWVAQEAIRGRAPFGGFPWGRLAFSQASAPTAGLAAIAGAPLITAAVAAIGALLAIAMAAPGRSADLRRLLLIVAAGVLLLSGILIPRPVGGQGSHPALQIAAVQGNVPEAGLGFNAERRAVLDNHAKATLALAQRVAAGQIPRPDLVIWPENSSDIDPLQNPDAARVINGAVTAIGVPIVLGAVLDQPAGMLSNASIVWTPGSGAGEMYVKQHPAPFGEYIPYRSFFRHFSDKVDLVSKDFTKGTRTGLLTVGATKLGDVICFEVAYDGLVRDSVQAGANLIAVQTNNATFGYTDESVQQLAMSRLRAIESGRSVVHISTVGISAIIRPDGSVEQRSGHFTQESLEAEVPLRTSQTIATRVGAWPEWILAGIGVILTVARRRRKDAVPVDETGVAIGESAAP